ncbi:MAG: Lrp/AsnC family transcriptional regulator [Nanoarchaeota archaeon]|nr:Lrp/AsnC family transcriptional regulator [Nanoarchaeota archaeon]
MDLLDKKIMYQLDLNARITASQLAKKLKKSKETINFRINRLIQNKYLKGFYTVFNTSKVGWHYIKFYIKFKNITPEKEKELFDYVSKQLHIAYLASVEGPYDCMILVMVKSTLDMIKFQDNFMKLYGEYIQEKDLVTFLSTHRLNERFLYEGKEKKDWYYPFELGNYKLDKTNKKILDIISTNARMSLIDIAKKINVDHKVVKYRLKKLEKDKIIFAYVTSPNFEKLGLSFFQINISLKDPTVRKQVIQFFNNTNKCLFAMELLGKYDILVEMHVEDHKELKKIIDRFRKQFVNKYNNYDTSTITKEYVMIWSPFAEQIH